MYILDTSAFITLGHYYPSRFPTIWKRIGELVDEEELWSVREVRREIETNCPFEHIEEWVQSHREVFRKPSVEEMAVVARIFRRKQFLGLVKLQNVLRGLPVADPFVVAAGVVYDAAVVTQENPVKGGARIPAVCREFSVDCIDIEELLEREKLQY